ncbi:bifunctional molybdenum cofactor biosynthesis protein MoaC/MoaB [Compostimonas suwonensis]|uniref:Cyclic pyranopterin monophosphate synthase n=1 Tax=Compostimonas suwonensis TaxID=1048394 RepID=A0A2M9BU35_9MICO|nr:bifunctional molybdenum cofactor biosynthesis protein MoaC/MoaB [Compostimonas suwonensis]PJJ61440.1 cyclic pyranopterin phosphate synthase [Compostimonas suwonensis]
MSELTHLDGEGRARMVDVSGKAETTRVAIARGRLDTTAEVLALVRGDELPKADVLATARIAGIMAAKKTSELIPLCHPIPLSSVTVVFELHESSIVVEAAAKTRGQTGVEMEALTAVAVAGLTLHDMIKAVDPAAVMNDVRLVSKSGGKHGDWVRPGADGGEPSPGDTPHDRPTDDDRSAVVLVSSTRSAAGERDDTTGPVIVSWLAERGYAVEAPRVVADADVATALTTAVAAQPAVVITTGGTGAAPGDVTPEATAAVLDRELPGVAEAIRARGLASTATAALSRGLAGTAGRTIVVNLPGSRGGVADGLEVLGGLLDHLVAQVNGGGDHRG